MKANLEALGHPTEVVPITAWDWWPTLAGGSFTFYMKKLKPVVERMAREHGKVTLVGHSAGGWIARLFVGAAPYDGAVYGGAPQVERLVTLGSPHLSLEEYPFGRVEEVREGEDEGLPARAKGSSLQYANYLYPTAADSGMPVVCIQGQSVLGRRWSGGSVWAKWIQEEGSPGGTVEEALALGSYEALCGEGNVWGDGITPVDTGLLPGAEHVVLKGVKHNPGVEGWYGQDDVVAQWEPYV